MPLSILWLLFMSVLFFLPGSALPKASWLDDIYFDKWVHIGLFAVLLFLWRSSFPDKKQYNIVLLIAAVAYGFAVEIIQRDFIPNRSFDLGDVAADTAGTLAGLWFWTWRYKKNRPL